MNMSKHTRGVRSPECWDNIYTTSTLKCKVCTAYKEHKPCKYSSKLPFFMSSVMMYIGSSMVHTAYSWISFWCRNFFIICASARKSLGSMVPAWHHTQGHKWYCLEHVPLPPPKKNSIMVGKQSRGPNVRWKPQYSTVCPINNLFWFYHTTVCSKSKPAWKLTVPG